MVEFTEKEEEQLSFTACMAFDLVRVRDEHLGQKTLAFLCWAEEDRKRYNRQVGAALGLLFDRSEWDEESVEAILRRIIPEDLWAKWKRRELELKAGREAGDESCRFYS